MSATVKTCSKCKVEKSVADFHRQTRAKDGLNWYCKSCNGAAATEHYYRIGKRVARSRNLQSHYGITIEDFEIMRDAQKGRCAICGRDPGELLLHVDHCHTTGRVRALLCSKCNIALGQADDNPARLRAMADYLETH
jgi:hypothetical protein